VVKRGNQGGGTGLEKFQGGANVSKAAPLPVEHQFTLPYIPIELPGIGPGLAKRVAWELHPNPAGYEYGRVPTLGQDNSYVFGEVGLPEAEITTLVEQGIIA
jgi:hypothetical protein